MSDETITTAAARLSSPWTELILLSGGIESTTLLYDRRGHGGGALFLNYGQRAARAEQAAARDGCLRTGTPLQTIDLRRLRLAFAGPGVFRGHIPLPARNLLAIALAANWALHHHIASVYLGIQRDDTIHSEAQPAVLEPLRATLQGLGIMLHTPYLGLTKRAVVAHGHTLGIDYTRTYSCLTGRAGGCGRCAQCLARETALQAIPPPRDR